MPDHWTGEFGIALHLVAAAEQDYCTECGKAIDDQIHIPNPLGLIAALAVCRAKIPQKLLGHEVRFIRKALKLSSKKLADLLEVQTETVSRWEHDKQPMNATAEKVLRLLAVSFLKERTAISVDEKEIVGMKLNAFRSPGEEVVISLRLIPVLKAADQLLSDAYLEARKAA